MIIKHATNLRIQEIHNELKSINPIVIEYNHGSINNIIILHGQMYFNIYTIDNKFVYDLYAKTGINKWNRIKSQHPYNLNAIKNEIVVSLTPCKTYSSRIFPDLVNSIKNEPTVISYIKHNIPIRYKCVIDNLNYIKHIEEKTYRFVSINGMYFDFDIETLEFDV